MEHRTKSVEDSERVEKVRFLATYEEQIPCLSPDTLWQRAFKNTFKVVTVNFGNSLSFKGLKRCRVKSQGS